MSIRLNNVTLGRSVTIPRRLTYFLDLKEIARNECPRRLRLPWQHMPLA